MAIICVDMQNEFVLPSGKLFVKEAPSCVPHCQKLIEFAKSKGAPVFWVIREHDKSGGTTQQLRLLKNTHMRIISTHCS